MSLDGRRLAKLEAINAELLAALQNLLHNCIQKEALINVLNHQEMFDDAGEVIVDFSPEMEDALLAIARATIAKATATQ